MILGIDLGTTKSVAGFWRDGKVNTIPDRAGNLSIPSLVLVTQDQNIIVGRKAQNHPERYSGKSITISSVKRLVGKKGEMGWGWWKTYPQEVSAFILTELRRLCEEYLGEKIRDVVIAIPSHFDESQRRATQEAAQIAGLNPLRLLNEATAACLTYGLTRLPSQKEVQKVLVFDLGGGTLDVSITELGDGVYEVKCIEGDSMLGGDDFTQVIEDYVLDIVRKKYGKEVEFDHAQRVLLKEASENAKIELSARLSANISFPGFIRIGTKFHDINVSIDGSTFETLSKHLVDRCVDLLKKAINAAALRPSDLDALLLLGGSSRIPFIREKIIQDLSEDPPRSFFRKRKAKGFMIEPFTGVDPEVCVAQGAAIQAGVFEGSIKEVLLLEALPSSYGVQLEGDEFSIILSKNTTVPTRCSKIFTTASTNQSSISIGIFQGENEKASENTFLGTLNLSNILPAEAGVPQIEVTFDVDANMIVNTYAKDLATGKEQNLLVKSPYGLNEQQMGLMIMKLDRWELNQ